MSIINFTLKVESIDINDYQSLKTELYKSAE